MQRQERGRKEPSEFNVIVKCKDLIKHTFTITNSTERFPKKYRFTLVNRIQDKAYLQYCRAEIEKHAAAIGLSLNNKTNIYPLRNGVDFLGFHTYLTETGAVIRKVRRRSKNNMKRKLKKMRGLVERGKITTATVEQSYKSWRGHAEKGNCYHLIRRTDHYYNRLFNSKEAEKCQKQ